MFVNGVSINGFLEKQQLKSQKYAQNAKVRIGIFRERVKRHDNTKTK